jgi:hypothetical protein
MDIENLMGLVNAQINDDARRSGVITLGALRMGLKQVPSDLPVVIEDGRSLGRLTSYRGYYERLSFCPTDEQSTVAAVLQRLDAADGDTFKGYKGGDFYMDSGTFLHVADYGDCGPYVSDLRVEADKVVIETTEEVW